MRSLKDEAEFSAMRKEFKDTIRSLGEPDLVARLTQEVFMSHPIPHWVKSREGKMIALNQAYTDLFGITLEEYINHYDNEVWDSNTAAKYSANDQQAVERGVMRATIEIIKDDKPMKLDVVKWTIRCCGQVFIAGKCHG